MLNGDIYASTDEKLDTITWFKSLSTSSNTYQSVDNCNPIANAINEENTYVYNLITTVTNRQ